MLAWSFLPVITKLSFNDLAPLASLAVASCFTLLAFAIALSVTGTWSELGVREAHLPILGHAIMNGVLFYSLIFWGTSLTTTGNVALLLLLETLLSVIILGGSGLETLSRLDIFGALLMVGGALLVVAPDQYQFNAGDLIILTATIVPVVGNYWSKLARRKVGGHTIMFARTLISLPFLFLLAVWTEQIPSQAQLIPALPMCALLGFLIMGLTRIWWIEAIHRIPIPRANSIASAAPLFTLVLAYYILNEVPTKRQLLAIVPMLLLLRAGQKKTN